MNDTGIKKIIIGILITLLFTAAGCRQENVTWMEVGETQGASTQNGQISGKEAYTKQEAELKTVEYAANDGQTAGADEPEEAEADKEQPEEICVYVCGAVKSPGVYRLSKEARAYEAVDAAGGFSEEAYQQALNLASTLQDGDMLLVPTTQEWEQWQETGQKHYSDATQSFTGQAQSVSEESDGLVNINTATREELCTLPGVGESRADSIIAYREEKGGFSTIEEIKNVSGIKDGLFQKIKDKIKVE